jgi:hypothetical protein
MQAISTSDGNTFMNASLVGEVTALVLFALVLGPEHAETKQTSSFEYIQGRNGPMAKTMKLWTFSTRNYHFREPPTAIRSLHAPAMRITTANIG